jgi:curved DNA-binding protein CbpA
MKSYHKILDIPADASSEQIDQHYHLLSRIYHPDRFDEPVDKAYAEWKLRELSTAYQALSTESPNTVSDILQAFV